MIEPFALIVRAACGDAQALAKVMSVNYEHERGLFLTLLRCDDFPPPLAALVEIALHADPPDTRCAAARRVRSDALRMLADDASADLRAALHNHLPATLARLAQPDEMIALTVGLRLTSAVEGTTVENSLIARIVALRNAPQGTDCWDALLADLRAALRAAVRRDPQRALEACNGDLWAILTEDERRIVADYAARHAHTAADLIQRIGKTGWNQMSRSARDALIQTAARSHRAAAVAGGAIWDALTNAARLRLARSAARSPAHAAALLERIGANGWRHTPIAARTALLAAIVDAPMSAAQGGGAVWPALDDDARTRIAYAVARNSFAAANLLTSIGTDGWNRMPAAARAMLLDAICRYPGIAARGGGAIWSALNDDERAHVAHAAAIKASTVADLLGRIGVDQWMRGGRGARAALLDGVGCRADLAVRCGAVWSDLDDEERGRIAAITASAPTAAADLLDGIGTDGWNRMPAAARAMLLDAICRDPDAAARGGGAIWTALDDEGRDRIARLVISDGPHAVGALLERIGATGWERTPAALRTTLVDAIRHDPDAAARGGVAIWTALDDEERARIADATARTPAAAAALLDAVGAQWRAAPQGDRDADAQTPLPAAVRAALIAAICRDPDAAARGGGAVWTALDDEERDRIARAAVQSAESAANLLQRIGGNGWRITPPEARTRLIAVICLKFWCAAKGGGAVWMELDDSERTRVAHAVAKGAASFVANLLQRIGGNGWRITPPEARTALLASVGLQFAMTGQRVRREVIAIWNAISCEDRMIFIQSVKRHVSLPLQFANLGEALDAAHIMPLLRAALYGRETSIAVAHALHAGAPWRPWMLAFAPDADAEAEVRDVWRSHACHLPMQCAVALLVRPQRRR